MMLDQTIHKRILAINPTHRGFGFVVLEGPGLLVDSGIRDVRRAKNARSTEEVARLLKLYRPEVLTLEDSAARGSRRRGRVKQLIVQISQLAKHSRIAVRKVPRLKVRTAFLRLEASNKHQIARVIAAQFPELTSLLPPERKPWMSEDTRMAVFDAAAFALVGFGLTLSRAEPTESPAILEAKE
jgi:hypothetical protein